AALDDAKDRAGAWAGGRLTSWSDGSASTATALVLADRGGPTPLCSSVEALLDATFRTGARATPGSPQGTAPGMSAGERTFPGPDRTAVLRCEGTEVAVGIGPQEDVARGAIGVGS